LPPLDTGGKIATGVNNTGGNLPPVSTAPAPVSTTLGKLVAKFATDVVDTGGVHTSGKSCRYQRHRWQFATVINNTGGKFANGVNDTGGK
jgi:hypothetical protein